MISSGSFILATDKTHAAPHSQLQEVLKREARSRKVMGGSGEREDEGMLDTATQTL